MVKLQDGSLVFADQLLAGAGEDDNGNPIKFKEVKDAPIPTYTAEADMNDGSGRKKNYTFGFSNTQVRVGVTIIESESGQTQAGGLKASQQETDPNSDQEKKEPEQPPTASLKANPQTEARVIRTEVPQTQVTKGKTVKLSGKL